MKRHLGLRAWIPDHHQGLVHARHLVRAATIASGELVGDQPDQAAVVSDFLAFWSAHINRHFREEEEVLLPLFARYGTPV